MKVSTCAQISIVKASSAVTFINTAPRSKRKHVVIKGAQAALHPLDIYAARPTSLHHLTFPEYFEGYEVSRARKPSHAAREIGQDASNKWVYQLAKAKVVRYSEYHPVTSIESFCFNVLLQEVPFTFESELISTENYEKSYFHECILRGIINDTDDLEVHLQAYATRNMHAQEHAQHTLESLYQKLSIELSM